MRIKTRIKLNHTATLENKSQIHKNSLVNKNIATIRTKMSILISFYRM